METTFNPRDYIDVLRRRILFVIVPTIVLSAAAIAFALHMPSVYEASAKILVEFSRFPRTLRHRQ